MSSACTPIEILWRRYVFPAFHVPACILSIVFLSLYLTAYFKNQLKIPKKLFYLGLAFLLCIGTYALCNISRQETFCHQPLISNMFSAVAYFLYLSQGVLLLITMFIRLGHIFKNSTFKLSKLTHFVFTVIICIIIASASIYIILLITKRADSIRAAVVALPFLLYVCLFIWMNYLFITRLLRLYQSSEQKVKTSNNDELMHIATKNAILCLVSSCTILLTAVSEMLFIDIELVFHCLVQFDLISNMLSVLLAYQYFDALYLRICGRCHRGCRLLCIRCAKGRNDDHDGVVRKVIRVQSVSSVGEMENGKSVQTTAEL